MSYIQECVNEYEKQFPEDWVVTQFNWAEDTQLSSMIDCIDKINTYYTFCSQKIIRSILSGEYVIRKDEVVKSLNQFKDLVKNEIPPKIDLQTLNHVYDLFKNIDQILSQCIDSYLYLVSVYENKYEDKEISYFLSSVQMELSGEFPWLDSIIKYVQPVCVLEYSLSFSDDLIKKAFLLREEIKEKRYSLPEELSQALLDKISFLLLKLQFVKDSKTSIYYGTIINELNPEELSSERLKDFEQRFYVLHKSENREKFKKHNLHDLERSLSSDDIVFSDMIVMMRCYQKSTGKLKSMKSILQKLSEKESEIGTCLYDSYALQTLKNYFYNSYFSKLMSSANFGLEELQQSLAEINELQEDTAIHNFHPYQKILEYLKNNYYLKTADIERKEFDLVDGMYKKCLMCFRDNIKWCDNNKFLAFNLPYGESLIEYADDLKVFYPSSFSRPLRYQNLKDEYHEYVRIYDSLHMRSYFFEEKEDIQEVKKAVQGTEVKTLEYLGVFTTVVTFLFGAIDMFGKMRTFKESLCAMIGMGLILWLFDAVIYFILYNNEHMKKNLSKTLFFGCGCAVFIILFVFLLIHFYPW